MLALSTTDAGRRGVGKAACRACRKHAGGLALLMLAQTLLRLGALAPLYAALVDAPFFGHSAYWWLVPGGAVFVFTVLPLRYWAGERLRFFSAPHMPAPGKGAPYVLWLCGGLMRCGRGLLWGLPFLAGAGLLLYGKNHLPFNVYGQAIEQFAVLIFQAPSIPPGMLAVGILLSLFGLLFAFGWWRDLPMEYLPIRALGVRGVSHFAAKARVRSQGALLKNALVNMALSLPALAGCAAVLVPYTVENLRATGDMLRTMLNVLRLIKKPLPQEQWIALGVVFLVLYLPLCTLRKMRNAVLVRRLTRELDGRGGNRAVR